MTSPPPVAPMRVSPSLSIIPAIAERYGGMMEREGAGGRVR